MGVLFALALLGAFLSTEGAYSRSHATQGAASVSAVVLSGHNRYHSRQHGGYYTSTYVAVLDGGGRTTVHARGLVRPGLVGARQSIKVDPHDRGYAEFPGRPFTPLSKVLMLLLAVLFVVAMDVYLIRAWLARRGAGVAVRT